MNGYSESLIWFLPFFTQQKTNQPMNQTRKNQPIKLKIQFVFLFFFSHQLFEQQINEYNVHEGWTGWKATKETNQATNDQKPTIQLLPHLIEFFASHFHSTVYNNQ